METITITQKDIEKAGIQFSSSGDLIDELAYSLGRYDFEDCEYYNYMPTEVYDFDFEKDLLENTKTFEQYEKIMRETDFNIIHAFGEKKHFGAYIALKYPGDFEKILGKYKEYLKENGTDTISIEWNKQLEKYQDEYIKECYNEYLYGSQSDYGIVYEIWKKYGYEGYFAQSNYNREENTFTLKIPREEILDAGYRYNQGKKYLLEKIYNKSQAISEKYKIENKLRKEEKERLRLYKEERAKQEEEERKQKLEALLK